MDKMKNNKKSPLEMLVRLFPKHPLNILQHILDTCQGDPVSSIERILDRYPNEADLEEVSSSSTERSERRSHSIDDTVSSRERRLHSPSDDQLSRLALAYDIPVSLGKLRNKELQLKEHWERKSGHSLSASLCSSEFREREKRDY